MPFRTTARRGSADVLWRRGYRQGLSDFGDVLAAQGALLSLEDGLESNAGSLTAALIRLYKALGGGWAPLSETNGDGGAGADARL